MRRKWVVASVLAAFLAAGASAAAQSSSPARATRAPTSGAASSCTSATIGIMAPLTGPGVNAVLGTDQLHWVQLYVDRWNKGHRPKIQLVWGDTRVGAGVVAKSFARNSALLATVGPAAVSSVKAAGRVLKGAGIAMVSASALADSVGAGLKGFFFRVAPASGTEGPTDAQYILKKLGIGKGETVMIVGDGKSYATSLGNAVAKLLQSAGVTVDRETVPAGKTDFSAVIGKIGAQTPVVFAPLAPQAAQALGQQMKAAGKTPVLFGAQQTLLPGTFTFEGSYVSFFAPFVAGVPGNLGLVRTFAKEYGPPGPFGGPAYAATQVIVQAIAASCAHGHKVSRALVRAEIAKTKIAKSILGMPIAFAPNGDLKNGQFWIYKIVKGQYVLQKPVS